MAEHQGPWPVSVRCEVLEVSRRGFDADVPRQATTEVDAEAVTFGARVQAIAADTRDSYGSRRMARQLQAEGFAVGRAKARRLMRQAGVAVQRPKRRGPVTTDSRHGYGVAPTLLARQFDVEQPDHVWAGDSTDVWTRAGWLSVAVLLDLYARTVVGWAMSRHIDTPCVQDALPMALGRRNPAAGLLHHSDRGSQYASHAYQGVLAAHGIRCRMSGTGECLDHAVAERFFGSLTQARTSHSDDATRQEAKDDIMAYIEMFYHSTRLHAYLGYVSPNDYEGLANAA
jgi:transposase InsO family protein